MAQERNDYKKELAEVVIGGVYYDKNHPHIRLEVLKTIGDFIYFNYLHFENGWQGSLPIWGFINTYRLEKTNKHKQLEFSF